MTVRCVRHWVVERTICSRRFLCVQRRCAHSEGVPRSVALSHWNALRVSQSKPLEGERGTVGKGMSFASSLLPESSRTAQLSAALTTGDVQWDLCERMDYHVQYSVPSSWCIKEQVRENSVSIQSSPPLSSVNGGEQPTAHGISLNCFAYKQRVKIPDNEKLLHTFLKRFNVSVGNSLQMVSQCGGKAGGGMAQPPTSRQMTDGHEPNNLSELLAQRLDSAVAEITFTPWPGQPLAHGLCRAFFSSNARYHYIAVVAVPEREFEVSDDLVMHAVMAVVESRVEAAAKNT